MNFNRLSVLSNLVTNDLKRKPTIVLEPNREHSFRMTGTANDVSINIDVDDWIIPDSIKEYLQEIIESDNTIEEKILKIYVKLCEDYTYDDNVLSYIKKNDDDTFFLPDAYGRQIDFSWKENRKKHNRRSCFEMSRILAKSVKEIIRGSKGNDKYDVCILWDEAVTHYFVGLVSNDYCVSLDLDDFTQIKDLTRMKTGLTLEGIKILYDSTNKFKSVLQKINDGRSKIAKDHIQSQRQKFNQSLQVNIENNSELEEYNMSLEDVEFLQYAVQILKETYGLDSAGIYEYIKEIVDMRIGARARKKVWKEVENNPGKGKRYTRCLIVTIDGTSYIIDVTKEIPSEMFREFDLKEIENLDAKIIPFKKMERNWEDDPYDGR